MICCYPMSLAVLDICERQSARNVVLAWPLPTQLRIGNVMGDGFPDTLTVNVCAATQDRIATASNTRIDVAIRTNNVVTGT